MPPRLGTSLCSNSSRFVLFDLRDFPREPPLPNAPAVPAPRPPRPAGPGLPAGGPNPGFWPGAPNAGAPPGRGAPPPGRGAPPAGLGAPVWRSWSWAPPAGLALPVLSPHALICSKWVVAWTNHRARYSHALVRRKRIITWARCAKHCCGGGPLLHDRLSSVRRSNRRWLDCSGSGRLNDF